MSFDRLRMSVEGPDATSMWKMVIAGLAVVDALAVTIG
jgi:hypothetical protein